MLLLVFDTETTGIIPKNVSDLDKCPYILQFSYIVYDSDKFKIVNEYNKIIHIPKSIEISEESTNIHGITKKNTNSSRTSIESCLKEFKKNVELCDYIIGHNIDFDMKMVTIECMRNKIYHQPENLVFINPLKVYCTMQKGINICKIEVKSELGNYYKWPKLSELHKKLFDVVPNNLHDAYNDILICLRCAVFMIYNVDIVSKDSVFKRKIKKLINL